MSEPLFDFYALRAEEWLETGNRRPGATNMSSADPIKGAVFDKGGTDGRLNGSALEFTYDDTTKVFSAPDEIKNDGTTTYVAWTNRYDNSHIGFSKTFVNLAEDGQSTRRLATGYLFTDFKGLELVPLDDLAAARPGDKVKVRAFLRGHTQKGVIIYVGHPNTSMTPVSKWLSNVEDYGDAMHPAMFIGVTDRDGIAELRLPEISAGSAELPVYIFTAPDLSVTPPEEDWVVDEESTIFRSSINFTLKR
jgi:hypothetical protein